MMNQFAKLLSSQQQTLILLDTCTIVSAYENKPEALELRKKIAHRKDIRIVVPSILIKEVSRVAKIDTERALELIESFSMMGQIDHIGQCSGEDVSRITSEADELKAKYLNLCHSPDNIYLVYCKNLGAVLVTYDSDLRMVARMEGIMTCTPGNFRVYQ